MKDNLYHAIKIFRAYRWVNDAEWTIPRQFEFMRKDEMDPDLLYNLEQMVSFAEGLTYLIEEYQGSAMLIEGAIEVADPDWEDREEEPMVPPTFLGRFRRVG